MFTTGFKTNLPMDSTLILN